MLMTLVASKVDSDGSQFGLPACAAAAGPAARARANLRSGASERAAAPERTVGHLCPIACMRG